jgi:hypothetical protein
MCTLYMIVSFLEQQLSLDALLWTVHVVPYLGESDISYDNTN